MKGQFYENVFIAKLNNGYFFEFKRMYTKRKQW
jgi:hypothetical protein